MRVSFSVIVTVFRWALKHWKLLVSFTTFPPLPDDWTKSEKVRIFFIAFMRADISQELVKLTETRWDDNLRFMLAVMAESPTLWNIAWEMVHRVDHEQQAQRKTLRERIRERIHGVQGEELTTAEQVTGTCELVTAIKTTLLLFEKNYSLAV